MTHDELRKTASEAVRKALIQPMCCMQGSGCELPPCHCSTVAADAVLAAVWDALKEPDAKMQEAMHHSALYLGIWQRGLAASPLRPAERKP